MRTSFITPKKEAQRFLHIAQNTPCTNGIYPASFIHTMRTHRGTVRLKDYFGETPDGLEYRNPIVIALGDSVTAGHFEFIANPSKMYNGYRNGTVGETVPIEVSDARVCYLELFRLMLIDHFEQTSVSTLNAGIAGDTIVGMQKRLYRDVIRHQPDLILLNASLNWSSHDGDIKHYSTVYRQCVHAMKEETNADIVLITPNMECADTITNPKALLQERVAAVREIASKERLPLVDVYHLWEVYQEEGYDIRALLSNGVNHPSVTGHEGYALALMQLIHGGEKDEREQAHPNSYSSVH